MSIKFHPENKIFKLDTASSSYALQINRYGYLLHLYYGAPVSDSELDYLAFTCSHDAHYPRVESESPEDPFFSKDLHRMEYSCNGCGDFRGSALTVKRSTGGMDTDIQYVSHSIYAGKPSLEGQPATYGDGTETTTLEILCLDSVSGAQVTLYYSVFESIGAMTRHAVVRNTSDGPMFIRQAMSTCVDFHDATDMDFIHLYGAACKERRFERSPLIHGVQGAASKRGCSSHMQNPFIALCSRDATEDFGDVYGFNLVYTGNFQATAEMDSDGGARVLMGINPDGFEWKLDAGESFTTPEAVMVYSNHGLGGMSRIFHKLYRNNLCRGYWKTEKRPILINNWEGTYFDFDEEKLYDIAKAASELGIEMLVMDDGWFGKRDDDKCALGDWKVNEDKLKGGLGHLIERVKALGLKFGIWYEPEMISPDSDLYRAHPDWCIHVPGRERSLGRTQCVIDMTREDVRDYLFGIMCEVLENNDIDYIKWDFNRNITEAGSVLLPPERQKEFFHRFVLGTYDLMDRIVNKFPHLLFENCSGGGGRYDPGMMYYSPQIWCSDNTDAIGRLDIQFGSSLCYPASVQGAHVSASKRTGYNTKKDVAMWGSFGYELDPAKISEEDKAIIRTQIAGYHKYYDLIHYGELYRIIPTWQNPYMAAWEFVSEDKTEAMFTIVSKLFTREESLFVRLKGLDPDTYYKCEENGEVYSGALLMYAGLNLSFIFKPWDGNSLALHFEAVE